MRELQRKQKIRRAIYSIPFLVILFIIAFFLVKGAVKMAEKEWESSGRVKDLEGKVAALILRELELKEDIARLESEEGIKDEIRGKFNVMQEGEHIAIIVEERHSSTSTDALGMPWYKKFWNAIISLYE